MVSYTRVGQLNPTIITPGRVLSVCDVCGALVVAAREDQHSKTHEVTE